MKKSLFSITLSHQAHCCSHKRIHSIRQLQASICERVARFVLRLFHFYPQSCLFQQHVHYFNSFLLFSSLVAASTHTHSYIHSIRYEQLFVFIVLRMLLYLYLCVVCFHSHRNHMIMASTLNLIYYLQRKKCDGKHYFQFCWNLIALIAKSHSNLSIVNYFIEMI